MNSKMVEISIRWSEMFYTNIHDELICEHAKLGELLSWAREPYSSMTQRKPAKRQRRPRRPRRLRAMRLPQKKPEQNESVPIHLSKKATKQIGARLGETRGWCWTMRPARRFCITQCLGCLFDLVERSRCPQRARIGKRWFVLRTDDFDSVVCVFSFVSISSLFFSSVLHHHRRLCPHRDDAG